MTYSPFMTKLLIALAAAAMATNGGSVSMADQVASKIPVKTETVMEETVSTDVVGEKGEVAEAEGTAVADEAPVTETKTALDVINQRVEESVEAPKADEAAVAETETSTAKTEAVAKTDEVKIAGTPSTQKVAETAPKADTKTDTKTAETAKTSETASTAKTGTNTAPKRTWDDAIVTATTEDYVVNGTGIADGTATQADIDAEIARYKAQKEAEKRAKEEAEAAKKAEEEKKAAELEAIKAEIEAQNKAAEEAKAKAEAEARAKADAEAIAKAEAEARAKAEAEAAAAEPELEYYCTCGYTTRSYDDLAGHMGQHVLHGEACSYTFNEV